MQVTDFSFMCVSDGNLDRMKTIMVFYIYVNGIDYLPLTMYLGAKA